MTDPDPALQWLVDAFDHVRAEVDITLIVRGVMMTGVLISAEDYAGNVAAELREMHGFTSPDDQGFDVLFHGLLDRARERHEQHEAAKRGEGEDKTPAEFLHLKDAWPVPGARTGVGGWWRIRLADIDGWTFGKMVTGR